MFLAQICNLVKSKLLFINLTTHPFPRVFVGTFASYVQITFTIEGVKEDWIGDFYESVFLCEMKCSKVLECKHELVVSDCENHCAFCKQTCLRSLMQLAPTIIILFF